MTVVVEGKMSTQRYRRDGDSWLSMGRGSFSTRATLVTPRPAASTTLSTSKSVNSSTYTTARLHSTPPNSRFTKLRSRPLRTTDGPRLVQRGSSGSNGLTLMEPVFAGASQECAPEASLFIHQRRKRPGWGAASSGAITDRTMSSRSLPMLARYKCTAQRQAMVPTTMKPPRIDAAIEGENEFLPVVAGLAIMTLANPPPKKVNPAIFVNRTFSRRLSPAIRPRSRPAMYSSVG